MKNLKLLLVGVAIVVISCTKTVYVDRIEYQKGKDSIIIQKRDSLIYRDVAAQFNEVITSQKSHLSTDYSFSNAWIDDSLQLHHNIQNMPKIPMKVEYVNMYKVKVDSIIKKETQIVEKKVDVPYIPWKAWLGWVLLGAGIVWKFRKFIGISV